MKKKSNFPVLTTFSEILLHAITVFISFDETKSFVDNISKLGN